MQVPDQASERIYYSTRGASKFLCGLGLPIAPTTLATRRCIGGGPRFQKFGRKVVYTQKALEDWVAGKLSVEVASTSDPNYP
jgi:hypothetical protein